MASFGQQSVTLGTHEGKFFEILDGLMGNEMVACDQSEPARDRHESHDRRGHSEALKQPGNEAGEDGRFEMKLADVSIRRPVFAFMMSLAMVTIGFFPIRPRRRSDAQNRSAPT
jgi:hypothetical protein